MDRLLRDFYQRDVLVVAPKLLGKELVTPKMRGIITEVEAYRGEEDLASHARFGRTKRNEIMYGNAGCVYMYLIYGMYWMLNIVTGEENVPQAILIRGVEGFDGPGKLTKVFGLDKSFYGEDLISSNRLWIEDNGNENGDIKQATRIGVDYAGEWKDKKWRWILVNR